MEREEIRSPMVRPGRASRVTSEAGAVLLLLLSGCMVGPDYERPDAAVNEDWLDVEDPRVSTDADEDAAWWKKLGDPVLDGLVEDAYRQNLSLRVAGVRVLQSMAARGISVGDLFPQQQDANAAFVREKISGNPTPPTRYANEWSVGFDVAWELDFWGKFRRAVEAADADLDASLANYDTVAVALISEVALAYVDIRTLQERIAIARRNVTLQERSLEIADTRVREGATSELDSVQTTALLEQTRAAIPAFEAALRQVVYRLNLLLGTPPDDSFAWLEDEGAIPEVPETVALGAPADLLRRRPDVRLAERQAAAASARVGVAEADLYPAFTLSGSVGLSSDDSNDLFEGRSRTGFIAPGVNWPVFNYGRIENNIRVQDADFQAAIVNYRNSVLSAAVEVESGMAAFLGSLDQAEHLALSATASRRSVEISTLQYREGETDYTRVLDSLVSLASIEDRLAATRGQAVSDLIGTYKALGGGWELRNGLEIVPEKTKREMRERTGWDDLLDADWAAGKDLGLIPRHDPDEGADARPSD